MMTQTKVQIDNDDYKFIKEAVKQLKYKSLSEYMREAVKAKVNIDRKRLREMKREKAIEKIGKVPYENLFESLEGEKFENC